jgi:hypothetical protein
VYLQRGRIAAGELKAEHVAAKVARTRSLRIFQGYKLPFAHILHESVESKASRPLETYQSNMFPCSKPD